MNIYKNITNILGRFLRKLEKYTKTDMVYLGSNISWISIGNGISSLASLGLVIVFGNLVSKNDYGIYQYVLSIAGVLSVTTLSGMNTSLVKAIASGSGGSLIEGIQTRIKWGILACIGSIGIGTYYFLNDNLILSMSFFVIAVFLPFMDSFTSYTSYLEGKKLFKQSAVFSSVISIIRVGVLVGTILLTKNIILIITTYIVITTLLRGIALLIVLKKIDRTQKSDPEVITYGKHLSLMRALSGGISSLDNILLFQFIGAAELAIYSFAKTPVTKISGAFTPIASLAYPKFAETSIETLKRTLPKKLVLLFCIMTGITVVYIILAPFLFSLVLPEYMDSVLFSQIFALSLLFLPQKIVGSALTAHKQQKALYVLSIANPIVRVASLVILIPIFGIIGVIISYLVGLLFNGILSYYYFFKMKP